MAKQVYTEVGVDFGSYRSTFWNWPGDNSEVPAGHRLGVFTITLNYFPKDGGTIGRADLIGRDSEQTAVWRVQIVYVEPHKTVHLPFPNGLWLEAAGKIEVGFVTDGPGEIVASLNGMLQP